MATLKELVGTGDLVAWPAELKRRELPEKGVYLLAGAYDAFVEACESEPNKRGLIEPTEQLSMRLNSFIGKRAPPRIDDEIKQISSDAEGLFEFRTQDTRLVGWFTHPGVFVDCEAFLKSHLRSRGGMAAVKARAFATRSALDLDPPKFLRGPYANVLG